jgi:pyridoxal/pyridoxine/pyridoxamine kinase
LGLTDKQITKVLFATQGVGILFAAVFLAAYLGGLPSTNVLHNEPVFRSSLAIIGAALLILVLATVILSVYSRRTINASV